MTRKLCGRDLPRGRTWRLGGGGRGLVGHEFRHEGGLVSPFLVIYNTDDDNAARETISDRLADIFDEVVAGGGVPSGGGATK
jgi:hypothetical protein